MTDTSNVSTQLVSHIRRFRDDAWNPLVLRRAELCLLDSLGCLSAARALKHFAPSVRVARRLFGSGAEATRLAPFAMAYLYGQAANALDYDDTLLGHPGAPIIGAVLAVGARENLPPDRILRGIAAGYEVHWLMAAAAAPSPERAVQVRSVGVWDTLAGSVGAGVALGLEDTEIARLMGVAVSHSLLPYTAKWYERPVPGMKNNLGWAAAGAVISLELALAGQSGVTNALEGDAGMWRMAGSDQWDFDRHLADTPALLRVGFKPFPVCWHMQEYLKTLSNMLTDLPEDDEMESIVLQGPKEIEKFCATGINGSADVAFSFPAAFSLLISRITPGPAWNSVRGEADALRFINAFRYQYSEERAVSLRTRSGLLLTSAVDKADSANPAPWGLDETGVLDKHRRLADSDLKIAAATFLESRILNSSNDAAQEFYRVIESAMVTEPAESARES